MARTDVSTPFEEIPFAHTDLDSQHGLSAFGLVLQLSHLNCLMPEDLQSALGIRMHYQEDWSYRLAVSPAAQSALRSRTRTRDIASSGWGISPWQPFTGSAFSNSAPWTLRACPQCLLYGYHSNLFQMLWIERCPWHDLELCTKCQGCGRPLGRNIERGNPLLLCECGVEPVDQQRLLEHRHPFESDRNRYIDRYLRWASLRRRSAILIGSVYTDLPSAAALSWLIRPPSRLAAFGTTRAGKASRDIHTRTLTVNRNSLPVDPISHAPIHASFAAFSQQSATVTELPLRCARPMENVSRSLALRCPEGSLSLDEWKEFTLLAERQSPKLSQIELILLPVFSGRDRLLFDARVLSRDVQTVLSKLCRTYLFGRYPDSFSSELAKQLYASVFTSILARGFADSAAACIRRHIPEYATGSRKAAKQWRPLVLMHSSHGKGEARIAWIRNFAGAEPPHASGSPTTSIVPERQ